MESKLFFVPSHHDFDKEGLEATAEMLNYEKWPLVNYRNEIIDENTQKLYKDAFNALTNIAPFWAKVSMEINKEEKVFMFPKRTWGKIYLYDDFVVRFSHDTRHDNAPFNWIAEWPELTKIGFVNDELQKIIDWSSIENWTNFFKGRIKSIAEKQINKAIDEQAKAEEQIKIGQNILDVLSL